MNEDDVKREIDRMIDNRKPNYEQDDGPLSDEQIRQLAIEADIMAPTWNHVPLGYQKFAELIVAECISIVTKLSPDYPLRYKNNLLIEVNHRDQIEEMFRGACVEEIKKHFGIE